MSTTNFLNEQQKQTIMNAIAEAEKDSSAEIRVHLDSMCLGNPVTAAIKQFNALKMHDTKEHNGVLVYVAYKSRKCAIVGDEGINKLVDPKFWDECYNLMATHFKIDDFGGGIAAAVLKAGEKLKEFFPYQSDDVNELSDEISFGK
ncbi:MAG: TPM domain-containing protein [Rikenellaceae bacterium]